MDQISFAEPEFNHKKKNTRGEKVLSQIDNWSPGSAWKTAFDFIIPNPEAAASRIR